jgi:hypothetical protein
MSGVRTRSSPHARITSARYRALRSAFASRCAPSTPTVSRRASAPAPPHVTPCSAPDPAPAAGSPSAPGTARTNDKLSVSNASSEAPMRARYAASKGSCAPARKRVRCSADGSGAYRSLAHRVSCTHLAVQLVRTLLGIVERPVGVGSGVELISRFIGGVDAVEHVDGCCIGVWRCQECSALVCAHGEGPISAAESTQLWPPGRDTRDPSYRYGRLT